MNANEPETNVLHLSVEEVDTLTPDVRDARTAIFGAATNLEHDAPQRWGPASVEALREAAELLGVIAYESDREDEQINALLDRVGATYRHEHWATLTPVQRVLEPNETDTVYRVRWLVERYLARPS